VGEGPVFVVGPLVHAGLERLRGWETVLWASDATWVIGLAMLRGEGPCIRRWSRW
jgi:hypothetical protein